jgi:hypothetical protein
MSSLTYLELPKDLLEPLLAGVLSLAEASELFDLLLQTPQGQWVVLPPRLESAALRLELWQWSPPQGRPLH